MRKLMLIGPGSVHLFRFYDLIASCFDEVIIISDRVPDGFRACKAIIADFAVANPIKAIQNYLILKSRIKNYNPAVIHVHQADSAAWLTLHAAKKLKIPVLVTAWGSDILVNPSRGLWYRKMAEFILKNANYLTADSHHLAREIKNLAGKECAMVTVVNFGVNLPLLQEPKENIIYSNRLHEPNYNIDSVIRAFEIFIRNEGYEWKLVVAGAGSLTESLKHLVIGLQLTDNIVFTGWLDRTQNEDYYKRSKVFVSVPSSDATSVSLLEAMAAGCIPVVSDLPANREWIRDGENGIIVPDIQGDFISAVLKLDRQKVVLYNNEIIRQKASKELSFSVFKQIYLTLAP